MKKSLFIVSVLLLFASAILAADDIKQADLAGAWYPASKEGLALLLEGYLKAANPETIEGDIFAVISPHAGYNFSGPVAAYSFKALEGRVIKTAVIIGFSHRKFFDGISIYDKGSFNTPLGALEIDAQLAKDIGRANNRIRFYPDAFQDENSVEMMLPFVRAALGSVKIVPIAFGTQSFSDAKILADALAAALKDRKDCVVIASTDLSHHHPYEEANRIDNHTISVLKGMKTKELYDEAGMGLSELCGIMPVTATLLAAEKLGFNEIKILKHANSGDTRGNKENVVGYLSAAIYKNSSQLPVPGYRVEDKIEKKQMGEERMLNDDQRKRLLQIARESITSFVKDGKRKRFTEPDPALNKKLGAFVTLHENGELRGCIGNLIGDEPLYQTVADMAVESATGDPRFDALSPADIGKIDIEISVLSPMKRVAGHEEIKIPGNGVVVRKDFRSGVYLPQVATETGWTREEFLTSLCGQKAGLAPDAWKDPATELYTFTAEVFGEKK